MHRRNRKRRRGAQIRGSQRPRRSLPAARVQPFLRKLVRRSPEANEAARDTLAEDLRNKRRGRRDPGLYAPGWAATGAAPSGANAADRGPCGPGRGLPAAKTVTERRIVVTDPSRGPRLSRRSAQRLLNNGTRCHRPPRAVRGSPRPSARVVDNRTLHAVPINPASRQSPQGHGPNAHGGSGDHFCFGEVTRSRCRYGSDCRTAWQGSRGRGGRKAMGQPRSDSQQRGRGGQELRRKGRRRRRTASRSGRPPTCTCSSPAGSVSSAGTRRTWLLFSDRAGVTTACPCHSHSSPGARRGSRGRGSCRRSATCKPPGPHQSWAASPRSCRGRCCSPSPADAQVSAEASAS